MIKTLSHIVAALWLCLCVSCRSANVKGDSLDWTSKVGSRTSPSSTQIYWVNDFGAVANGSLNATKGIQAAIDAASAAGGGIVAFGPGSYLMGAIYLKSHVHLRIDQDVLISGSQDFKDYPDIDTRIAGLEMQWPSALINVLNAQDVKISGEGKVNARGKFCWDKYWAMRKEYEPKGLRWVVDYDAKRVRTLLVQHSSDVTLQGLRFSNAGFWTIQLLYSDHLTVDGVTIRNNEDGKGPSTDGVDIDSSSWVLVENCDIDCNDDDFCLKAGRDWDGLRVNRPTEYVVIKDCIARKGGGLVTLGSETSGGIRHVLATGLNAHGTGNGFHIKSAMTRGGVVEDIHFRNAVMDSVGTAFTFTMNWNPAYSYSTLPAGYDSATAPHHWKLLLRHPEPPEKGIPTFRNIYVDDVKVTHARKGINAEGVEVRPLQGFHFNQVQVDAATLGSVKYDSAWTWKDVHVQTADGTRLRP